MRSLHPAIWLVPAVMLLVGVFPLPYGYYQLLRVIVFACAALICWKSYVETGKMIDQTVLVFGAVALLMNPFMPVSLPNLIWVLVDLLLSAIFLGHLLRLAKSRRLEI